MINRNVTYATDGSGGISGGLPAMIFQCSALFTDYAA